ncbi:MAG TPA: heparinase II/III family protein [Pelobium sp.]|nr:heparinase II/III family protein [Pelobium sp.]
MMVNQRIVHFYTYLILVASFCLPRVVSAQKAVRPMIWVMPNEREAILNKIKTHKWATEYYSAFKERVQPDLESYLRDPKAYLSNLPFDFSKKKLGKIPPFQTVFNEDKDANIKRNQFQKYLKTGVDCSVLYYLTGDKKYAQYSSSVFYTFMKAMLQIEPSGSVMNGGWLYQDDHLREAREVGAQIPVLYDFIVPFIKSGGTAYNFVTNTQDKISIQQAEQVFKTYINLALNHGIVNCNWPVLESPSLVGNILALDSKAERDSLIAYYLHRDTPNQDALAKVAMVYKKNGDWPESLNYSSGVTELTTYLMTMLTRIDPSLALGKKYPEVTDALTLPYYLTYPNGKQTIQFGDGHRGFSRSYNSYEIGYCLAKLSNDKKNMNQFGSLINSGIESEGYNRAHLDQRSYGAHPYFDEPIHLLWSSGEVQGLIKDYPKPTTNGLAFAGISIQRNLSNTNQPKDGLMLFVGGAAFVHGHASGMNVELYGEGYVLGSKAGRATYRSEIHENYYRLFAGHNTVIVNGASRGEGGWANNGINTVKKEAIEPLYFTEPVSPNNSFSTTSFVDDKGDLAEAKQLRTLAIVRTSPTTGYYVDVYKSKSTLPNQYHDYIYHNVGDFFYFMPTDDSFILRPNKYRYMANADAVWKNNRSFKNPGWHYFKNVETSGVYNKQVDVVFTAKSLGDNGVSMKLFIPGEERRDYTKIMAPVTYEAPRGYDSKLTPTLAIRQIGEAWDAPFAVIYEPYAGVANQGSIKTVNSIKQNGVFKGFVVESKIQTQEIKQIIITQDEDTSIFYDKHLGIKFIGRYAVLSLDKAANLQSLYIGSGTEFSYKQWELLTEDSKPSALNLAVSGEEAHLTTNAKLKINHPVKYKVIKQINKT